MNLEGFTDVESLYVGSSTHVVRARREASGESVILKLLRERYPAPRDVSALEREWRVLKSLDVPGVVRPIALGALDGRPTLTLADDHALEAAAWVAEQRPPPAQIVRVAAQLARALAGVHDAGFIHRDVTPNNVVVTADARPILIDFGLASRLASERSEHGQRHLQGTLPFLSPEQTGRTSREVDYRTDLYSFGATLFTMLAGRPPFVTEDANAMLHAHLARRPPDLAELVEGLPPAVSAIVARLLEKAPERRYQSAHGLADDLERALDPTEDFALGASDFAARFEVSSALYGRDEARSQLVQAVRSTGRRATELVLVYGYSGIGKSSLVAEVHSPLLERRGYFAVGKFDQLERDLPYSGLTQALQHLLQQVLAESEVQIDRLREELASGLGPLAGVLVKLLPELSRLVSASARLAELSGSQAQNRLLGAFAGLLRVLCRVDHPVVLFIDDLQWADRGSLELLEKILCDPAISHLLVVGAYRDNEVHGAHPLRHTLEALRLSRVELRSIELGPLAPEDVRRLLEDTLRPSAEDLEGLATRIYDKTAGNPFYVHQLLRSLQSEGAVRFDRGARTWRWQADALEAAAPSHNVVELMTARIEALPEPTRQALSVAACVGGRFSSSMVAAASRLDEAALSERLWPAVQVGLLRPVRERDPAGESDELADVTAQMVFLHDRVQQAAFDRIPVDDRPALHLEIGRELLARAQGAPPFSVLTHLNAGRALIADDEERARLARLDLEAAERAYSAAAWQEARRFSRIACELLGDDDEAIRMKAELLHAETSFLTGDHEGAETLFAQLLPRLDSSVARARVQSRRISLYENAGQYDRVLELGAAALAELGIDIPSEAAALDEAVQQQRARFRAHGEGLEVSRLLGRPEKSEARWRVAQSLLMHMSAPAYFLDEKLCELVVLLGANVSLEHGHCPASAIAYGWLGVVLTTGWDEYEMAYRFGELSLALNERFDSPELKSKLHVLFGLFVKHWRLPIRESVPEMQAAVGFGLESGDLAFAGYGAAIMSRKLLSSGRPLAEVSEHLAGTIPLFVKARSEPVLEHQRTIAAAVDVLRTPGRDPLVLSHGDYDEAESLRVVTEAQFGVGIAVFDFYRLLVAVIFERFDAARGLYASLTPKLNWLGGMCHVPEAAMLGAVAVAAEDLRGRPEQAAQRAELERLVSRLREWARACPENYESKAALARAELHRVDGEHRDAVLEYERAVARAGREGLVWDEAIACEATARFYAELGAPTASRAYRERACTLYRRWGAEAKARLLSHVFTEDLDAHIQGTRSSVSQSTSTSDSGYGFVDIEAFAHASRAIAQTLELEPLLRTLMRIVVENAGATWAALAVAHGERPLRLEARMRAGEAPEVLLDIALEADEKAPPPWRAVIDQVARTQRPRIEQEGVGSTGGACSVLCLPLVTQGRTVGVLYLENDLAAGAFTADRVEMLGLLSGQLAIALEKARLYSGLEEIVDTRTRELQDAMRQLERAQTRLVVQEKMASLGALVAGVAHEINTPLGAVSSNVETMRSALSKLSPLWTLARGALTERDAERGDRLLRNLDSMLGVSDTATDRIQGIVSSLRQFARLDRAEADSVQLADGIETTLDVLRPTLPRGVEIVTDLAPLPDVACFPSKMNQVFMNLFVNAAQALEGDGRLSIRTRADGEWVRVEVTDDGRGIPPEHLERIFDPGFTTKGPKVGTGLGLSIVHGIVVDDHGGDIEVKSAVGVGTTFTVRIPIHGPVGPA